MKEISKRVILAVTLFHVEGHSVGNIFNEDQEYVYVGDFIKKNHADAILALRTLLDTTDNDKSSYIYYTNIPYIHRYIIYVDNFVNNIYILIRDILLPDNEDKIRRDTLQAYAADAYTTLEYLKNPKLVNDEGLDRIRQAIKESK